MFQLSHVVAEFEETYDLPRKMILDCIQDAMEAVLQERYKRPVQVELSENGVECSIIGVKHGVTTQFELPLSKIRGWNAIKKSVTRCLQAVSASHDLANLNTFHNSLVWGIHVATDEYGVAYFKAEFRLGENYICVCEPRDQLMVERREGYLIGERRAFEVKKMRVVFSEGVPLLKIMLSRTGKNLPIRLLIDSLACSGYYLNKYRLVVVTRFAGARTIIAASERLPREVISGVSLELREGIKVVLGRQAEKHLVAEKGRGLSKPRRRGGKAERLSQLYKKRFEEKQANSKMGSQSPQPEAIEDEELMGYFG